MTQAKLTVNFTEIEIPKDPFDLRYQMSEDLFDALYEACCARYFQSVKPEVTMSFSKVTRLPILCITYADNQKDGFIDGQCGEIEIDLSTVLADMIYSTEGWMDPLEAIGAIEQEIKRAREQIERQPQ